tara:strand:+ start:3190 stop:4554 length:1365 start_codon:yes stop_codon:yes gene_type:complete
MSSPNIVNVEKFEVLPSNQPSNNTYSFRNGNPIITISVPAQAKYLRPSSVRINGVLKLNTSAGANVNNNDLNTTLGAGKSAQLSSRVGVHSCFQNVVLSSEATNQSLEAIRQYGRLVSTILSSTHTQQDFMTEKSVTALMNGFNSASGNLVNNEVNFSIPLYCGLLQGGNPIPLSQNGINGLRVQLELASDQQLLSGANAGDASGAFFELKNISLTGDLLVPDEQGVQQLSVAGSGGFQYNSWSSLYSVINSSDSTQTYNLANSQVLSVVHTFLPVNASNNYASDGFANPMLKNTDNSGTNYDQACNLKKVSFSRGGVKLGFDYDFDCEEQNEENVPETQVLMNYLNAFQPIANASRMLNSKQLMNFGGNDLIPYRPVLSAVNRSQGVDADPDRNFGIGLAMDRVSNVGVSFKGQSYATRIVSDLDGKSPNAVFTFILSKNVLQYSPSGILIAT